MSTSSSYPIGIFDSGVGGLSVLRHIQSQFPYESLIYIADQAHVPYGNKSAAEIIQRCQIITDFLLTIPCKIVVIACNTATAAALSFLRIQYPHLLFVGTEPAIKPGAKATITGKVGVLARAGTFESQRYRQLMRRYAQDVTLLENSCEGLVELIESGQIETAEMTHLLATILDPMLAQQVDTFVLGCTHYPFVQSQIRTHVGADVAIIDPAPAVARQVGHLLELHGLVGDTAAVSTLTAYTTGDQFRLQEQIFQLLGLDLNCHHLPL